MDFKQFVEEKQCDKIDKINDIIDPHEEEILRLILTKKGTLRTARPTFDKERPITGEAYYVWRMSVFFLSNKRQHQCMPYCADIYLLTKDYDERRQLTKKLDLLVDKIVNSFPKSEWHGVRRWGEALLGL